LLAVQLRAPACSAVHCVRQFAARRGRRKGHLPARPTPRRLNVEMEIVGVGDNGGVLRGRSNIGRT